MGCVALTVSLCVVKTNMFGLKHSSVRILYKLMMLTEFLKYTKYDLKEFLRVADLWRMPTCLLWHTISSVLVWMYDYILHWGATHHFCRGKLQVQIRSCCLSGTFTASPLFSSFLSLKITLSSRIKD